MSERDLSTEIRVLENDEDRLGMLVWKRQTFGSPSEHYDGVAALYRKMVEDKQEVLSTITPETYDAACEVLNDMEPVRLAILKFTRRWEKTWYESKDIWELPLCSWQQSLDSLRAIQGRTVLRQTESAPIPSKP